MGHDATKVLLGSTRSSSKQGSDTYAIDPATFPAGTAVRLNSAGLLSVTKADGRLIGVSLGRSMSDSKMTTVINAGEQIPILLTDDSAGNTYAAIGSKVAIDDATGLANAAGVGVTASDAIYVSGPLTGIDEDGNEVPVAMIDMAGGL